MTTSIIIVCCIVIPLILISISLISSHKAKSRKVWEEEREKIKAYGEQINQETRNKKNEWASIKDKW